MNNNTYVLDSKKKVVVIHQPDFLPYIGFFHRFLYADLWVMFDNVQFLNNSKSWHNRDKIKTHQGAKWLTISVKKCSQKTIISDVELSKERWKELNLNLIKSAYMKAPFFKEIFPYIEDLYSYECDKMIDFNLKSIIMINKMLNISIKMVLSSALYPEGTKNELLIDILKKVNATHYLTGIGSKGYLIPDLFDENCIQLIWQNFEHPMYNQLYGNFIPNLSIIDMLFNCGIDQSQEIIRKV